MQQDPVNIVIADDHPVFRSGLRQLVEAEPGLNVVGEAENGVHALKLIQEVSPSIAILDVAMPELDGLALARDLQRRSSPVKIILITMYREEKFYAEALKAGVKGYVLKDSAATDIINCIRLVAADKNYASPELTNYLVRRVKRLDTPKDRRTGLESLSDTELRILSMIAEYKTNKEIAQELFISPRTVETHRNNICRKLTMRGSHALLKFALENKHNLH